MVGVDARQERGGRASPGSLANPLLVLGADRLPDDGGDLDPGAAQIGDPPGVLGIQTYVYKSHSFTVMTSCLYVKPDAWCNEDP